MKCLEIERAKCSVHTHPESCHHPSILYMPDVWSPCMVSVVECETYFHYHCVGITDKRDSYCVVELSEMQK